MELGWGLSSRSFFRTWLHLLRTILCAGIYIWSSLTKIVIYESPQSSNLKYEISNLKSTISDTLGHSCQIGNVYNHWYPFPPPYLDNLAQLVPFILRTVWSDWYHHYHLPLNWDNMARLVPSILRNDWSHIYWGHFLKTLGLSGQVGIVNYHHHTLLMLIRLVPLGQQHTLVKSHSRRYISKVRFVKKSPAKRGLP